MGRCLDSFTYEELADPLLSQVLVLPSEILRAVRPQEGDRVVLVFDPEMNELRFQLKQSHFNRKKQFARDALDSLSSTYPNKFRTRQEGKTITTTFWPNGYSEDKNALKFEGVANVHPNDRFSHEIGKAIASIRALDKCEEETGKFHWYSEELRLLTR